MRIYYLILASGFFALGYLHEGIELSIAFYHNLPNANAVLLGGTLIGAFNGSVKNAEAVGVGLGLVIYEFMQLLLPARTFDVLDLVFTVIGVGVLIGLLYLQKWVGTTVIVLSSESE